MWCDREWGGGVFQFWKKISEEEVTSMKLEMMREAASPARFRGHNVPGRRSGKSTGLEEDTSLVSQGIQEEQLKCTGKPEMEREAGDTVEKWSWGVEGPKVHIDPGPSPLYKTQIFPRDKGLPYSYGPTPQPLDGYLQEALLVPPQSSSCQLIASRLNLGMLTSRKFFPCVINKSGNNSNSFSVVLSNHSG